MRVAWSGAWQKSREAADDENHEANGQSAEHEHEAVNPARPKRFGVKRPIHLGMVGAGCMVVCPPVPGQQQVATPYEKATADEPRFSLGSKTEKPRVLGHLHHSVDIVYITYILGRTRKKLVKSEA